MKNIISTIKGIHPGVILEYKLKKAGISKREFSRQIDEHPQTIISITKQKRNIHAALSVKIGKFFKIDTNFFMLLQAYYEVAEYEKKIRADYHPALSKFRPVLFWDTKIEHIDWQKNKKWIIQRVLQRGNCDEKEEITAFYGKREITAIEKTLKSAPHDRFTLRNNYTKPENHPG